MEPLHEIYQTDGGRFQISLADDAPGPFESRRFAEAVASGYPPAPAPPDAALAEMGALDLVYPELTGSP